MTNETVEKWICKPCGRVFGEMSDAVSHAAGHRTKPYQNQTGQNKAPTKNMIRCIETTERELEKRTLHEIASVEPPEDTEPEYLTENDRDTSREGKLKEWEG